MTKRYIRKKYFIEPKVQGALLLRTSMYWCFCLLTIAVALLCWSILSGPFRPFWLHVTEAAHRYGPAFVVAIFLLPVVIWDSVRLSNRFAGPIYRLRRSLHDLAEGKDVQPIQLREGDFWQDVADEFNRVAAQQPALTPTAAADGDETHLEEPATA